MYLSLVTANSKDTTTPDLGDGKQTRVSQSECPTSYVVLDHSDWLIIASIGKISSLLQKHVSRILYNGFRE